MRLAEALEHMATGVLRRVAAALAERGWLFRVFAAAGPLRGEVFVVPDELLAVLPVPQSESGRSALSTFATLATAATLPSERRSSDPAFSLFALVSALTRAGGHLEAEVRAWSEEPGGWAWDTRWTFLQHLAASTGLVVHRVDGRLVASAGLGRLLDDPSALAERLRRGYLGDAGWSELVRSGVVDDPGFVDTLALRRAIVDLVDQ